jgi:hypothetical protein
MESQGLWQDELRLSFFLAALGLLQRFGQELGLETPKSLAAVNP